MAKPKLTDYVELIHTLFDQFAQVQTTSLKRGHPFEYKDKSLLIFFTLMQFLHITKFKAQHRWLSHHLEHQKVLEFKTIPVRTTLSRRYKVIYGTLQDLIAFVGTWVEELEPGFSSHELYEDKSLFKTKGPVWHQSDRKADRIPKNLRNLNQEASWTNSAYHGWVYGLHLTCSQIGFPKLVQVETGSVREGKVLGEKETHIFTQLHPNSLTADDAYTKAMRIRKWAKNGVALITPALRWKNGRYAKTYHQFIQLEENQDLLRSRRTAIEPVFDLIAKLIEATDNHKQIAIQGLQNVRTYLALAVFTLQLAMIGNSIWAMPIRAIAHIKTAFT
jgi:hypothetical protein